MRDGSIRDARHAVVRPSMMIGNVTTICYLD
jgi:hypothetical protein